MLDQLSRFNDMHVKKKWKLPLKALQTDSVSASGATKTAEHMLQTVRANSAADSRRPVSSESVTSICRTFISNIVFSI